MSSHSRNVSIVRFVSLGIILLGFALRTSSLDHRSLWFDEAMEFWVAYAPLPNLLPTVKQAVQDPPLYSLLLHGWLPISHTEFSIRFLSLGFSMVGLLGVMVLAQVTAGRPAALLAGLFMAISVPDIRFAQEAGQYALMVCGLTWNLVFLSFFCTRGTWRWALLWALSAVTVCYSYYGAAVILGATTFVSLITLTVQTEWPKLFKLSSSGALCALLLVPLAIDWLPEQLFRGPTATAFQPMRLPLQEELTLFFTQTKALLIYQILGYQADGWPWPHLPEWALWLPVLLLILLSATRHRPRIRWFVASLFVYYGAGRLGVYVYGGWRYALIIAPLFWVCIAAGLARLLAPKWWRLSPRNVIAYAIVGLLIGFALYAPREPQEDLRTITQQWASSRQPDDLTYVYYGAVPGFRYQFSLLEPLATAPPLWYWHCWRATNPAYCVEKGVVYGRFIRQLSAEQKQQAVLETLSSHRQAAGAGSLDRLWLVFSHTYAGEDAIILAAFQDTYQIAASYAAENSALFLLERR